MIAIEYDQALVENVTFLAVRRDAGLERELHEAVDPLYEIADERARQQAFARAYREFFTRLGLDRIVTDLIAERPIISERVTRCRVREASRAKEEGAELYAHDAGAPAPASKCALMILARPESLLETERFRLWMRRELLHAADMLDERFAYTRDAIAPHEPRPRQNLLRDRFGVLWDTYVEGRLHREGHSDSRMIDRLRRAFHQVFGDLPEPVAPASNRCAPRVESPCHAHAEPNAFTAVFDAPALNYSHLLAWARDPEMLLDRRAGDYSAAPRGRRIPPGSCENPSSRPPSRESLPTNLPQPGGLCPLCGFPTHDWFDFDSDAPAALTPAIRLNHTDWTPDKGACRQCAEIYEAAANDAPAWNPAHP